MRRATTLTAVGLLVLAVAGCGEPKADHGIVTDTWREAEYVTFQRVGEVTVPIVHPEKWCIRIDDPDSERAGTYCWRDRPEFAVGDTVDFRESGG